MTAAVTPDLDRLAIDTIRTLSIDAVQQANSGHPGAPMGAAPMAYVLWTRFLRHAPTNPDWPDRDRFVLSRRPRQHAALLAPPPDRLRPLARRPQGVPPVGLAHAGPPGVRPDAGRRGDDRPARPGLRERGRHGHRRAPAGGRVQPRRARDRRPLDVRHRVRRRPPGGHRVRGLEPRRPPAARASWSSCTTTTTSSSTARRRWPGRRTSPSASMPTAGTPSGSRTATTSRAIEAAIEAARADDRPSLIAVRTHIGFGSPNKQDTQKAHGAPLGPDEVRLTKEAYGWDPDKTFYVPEDALRVFREAVAAGEGPGQGMGGAARRVRGGPSAARPRRSGGASPGSSPTAGTPTSRRTRPATEVATRNASARTRSRRSRRPGARAVRRRRRPVRIEPDRRQGRAELQRRRARPQPALRRPRARRWAAIANGIAYHGGFIPYDATFLTFSDYMRGSVRLACAVRAARRSTSGRTTRSASARTGRPTSRSSTTPRCGRSRTCGSCGRATRTRRPRPGRSPSSGATARWRWPSPARSCRRSPGTAEKAREGVRRGGYVLREATGAATRS